MTEFDGITHFNALLLNSNLHASAAYRMQADIDRDTHGSTPNPWITFDSSMNAAKVVTPPGDGVIDAGIPVGAQLRLHYPLVDKTTGETEISHQWEARWSSDYLDVTSQGLTNQKSFMIGREAGNGDYRKVQVDLNFNRTDVTAVGTPTIRVYVNGEIGGAGDDGSGVIRTASSATPRWNHQPGGPGYTTWDSVNSASDHLRSPDGPFVILVDKWVRFTTSITFTGGQQRLRVWMQHEDEAQPTLVIADPADPSQGFLIDGTGDDQGTDNFWIEFNSSNVRPADTPALVAWVRNLLVFKNATVPLKTGKTMVSKQTFTIVISAGSPTISSGLPPTGDVGQDYSHTFLATGGVLPYRWVVTGQLPPGLTLTGNVLFGKPTQVGAFTAEIEVKNAA